MSNQEVDPDLFKPLMPEVDFPAKLEDIFEKARKAAAADTTPAKGKNRNVIVVTPGRMVMLHPCPAPGTMNPQAVESVEKLMPSKTRRNVAVIAYTELKALRADVLKTIPFYGLLTGLAYIGHAVWVFEGHSSALAAGCREADLLIADCEMVPFLTSDWMRTSSSVMRRALIFAHDRANLHCADSTPAQLRRSDGDEVPGADAAAVEQWRPLGWVGEQHILGQSSLRGQRLVA